MALNVNLTFDLVVTLTHLIHPSRAHHPNSLPSVTDEVSHSIDLVTRKKRALPFARTLALNCGYVSILRILSYLPVFYF